MTQRNETEDFASSDTEDEQPRRRGRRKERARQPGDDANEIQLGKKTPSRFLKDADKKYPQPVTPSIKTTTVKNIVLKWQDAAPDDKIISKYHVLRI